MTTKTYLRALAVVAAAGCLVSGCSKSSKTPSAASAAAATAGATAPAGAAAAVAGATGAGGPLDESKQCAAIKPTDIQALMKAPVTPVVNNPGECSFYAGALKVELYANDPTQKYYQNPVNGPGTTPVPGVGDQAQWSEPASGHTTPWLESHKGSLTCIVSPADPDQTTITYTGSPPIVTIAPADAIAYAAKEGAVCNDVFSAS